MPTQFKFPTMRSWLDNCKKSGTDLLVLAMVVGSDDDFQITAFVSFASERRMSAWQRSSASTTTTTFRIFKVFLSEKERKEKESYGKEKESKGSLGDQFFFYKWVLF